MALLTLQTISKAGVVPSFVSANAGGDTAPANTRFLYVKNGGSSITLTITPTGTTTYGASLPAQAITVASGEKIISLADSSYVNSNNVIPITYSGVTSVTIGAFTV